MTKYEDVIPPYKTYALPHGASTPSQAAFLSQKHNNKHQNSLIGSGKSGKLSKHGGKIVVPSFVGSTNPSSPVNSSTLSKDTGKTITQGRANAEFDGMVNSKPKQLSVSEFRGGRRSSRRSRHNRKSRRRGSRRRGSPRRRLKRHKSMSKRKRHTKRRRRVYK